MKDAKALIALRNNDETFREHFFAIEKIDDRIRAVFMHYRGNSAGQ